MEAQRQLFYVSRSAEGLAETDIDRIVTASIEGNSKRGITGKLLFSGEHFAQVLQGAETALRQLMRSIEVDARHHDVRVFLSGDLTHHVFADWSMAYVRDLGMCDLLDEIFAAPSVSLERATRLIGHLFRHRG